MPTNPLLTEIDSEIKGKKRIFISGGFAYASATYEPDEDHIVLEVGFYGNDSKHGMSGREFALDRQDGKMIIRGTVQKSDSPYLFLALGRMKRASPPKDYAPLVADIVEALSICPPQPSRTK